MIRKSYLISLLVLAGTAAIPASATLVTYSSQAAFNTATAGTQTFTNIVFPSGSLTTPYSDATTTTSFNATFSISGTPTLSGVSGLSGWPSGNTLQAGNCSPGAPICTTTLTITLPSAVTSFEMFYGVTNENDNAKVTVDNSGGDAFSQNPFVGPTPIFFGFTTDTPITTFTLQGFQKDEPGIAGVEAGTADTPEAATLILVGGGLLMLRFGRRWLPRRTSTFRRALPGPAIGGLYPQSARG